MNNENMGPNAVRINICMYAYVYVYVYLYIYIYTRDTRSNIQRKGPAGVSQIREKGFLMKAVSRNPYNPRP